LGKARQSRHMTCQIELRDKIKTFRERQLAISDQPHAQSAAIRFGGLGRRYILVAFDDCPVGLLSHADGSGLLPEARPKLTALSWEEIRLALMLDIGSN
jgi:hypothetical protein